MTAPAYVFPATVDSIIDGDTLVATILLADVNAFHERQTWAAQRVWRLARCNAREHSQPGGPEATAHLAGLLPAGTPMTITSIKVDPYTDSKYESARYDAEVTLIDGRNLTDLLASTGWVALWDGKTQPRPLPPWPIPAAVPPLPSLPPDAHLG